MLKWSGGNDHWLKEGQESMKLGFQMSYLSRKKGSPEQCGSIFGCHSTKLRVAGLIPVRARAWVVGSVPSQEAYERQLTLMFLSHIDVSLLLSCPVSPFSKK